MHTHAHAHADAHIYTYIPTCPEIPGFITTCISLLLLFIYSYGLAYAIFCFVSLSLSLFLTLYVISKFCSFRCWLSIGSDSGGSSRVEWLEKPGYKPKKKILSPC